MADAIKEGGVTFIEITMSVQGAIDVIKELTQKYKDEIIMGAGTILDPETGRAALLAGAQFIVSPTLNLDLIQLAHRYSAVVIPGAMTPTEILTAWNAGADMVKVFPGGPTGRTGIYQGLERTASTNSSCPYGRSESPECRSLYQGRSHCPRSGRRIGR